MKDSNYDKTHGMLLESQRKDAQLPEGFVQGFTEEVIIQLGLEGVSNGCPLICILGKGTQV